MGRAVASGPNGSLKRPYGRMRLSTPGGRGGRARTRMLRGVVLRELLVLQHVEQRRLARVVEAEEEDLGVLVREAERVEHRPEVVEEPHGGCRHEATASARGHRTSGLLFSWAAAVSPQRSRARHARCRHVRVRFSPATARRTLVRPDGASAEACVPRAARTSGKGSPAKEGNPALATRIL